MSTIFDVTGVTVEGDANFTIATKVEEVTITDTMTTPSVTVSEIPSVSTVVVETMGPQGAPGLQNVFVQHNDPSKNSNGDTIWGPEQFGFVWIQV